MEQTNARKEYPGNSIRIHTHLPRRPVLAYVLRARAVCIGQRGSADSCVPNLSNEGVSCLISSDLTSLMGSSRHGYMMN